MIVLIYLLIRITIIQPFVLLAWFPCLGSGLFGETKNDSQQSRCNLQKTRFLLPLQLIKESTRIAKAHTLVAF